MKILVCGGRDYSDAVKVDEILSSVGMTSLICGMARGADSLAYNWAKRHGLPIEEFPAQWNTYGRSAGYIRNAQMLREGKPDLVIAFPGGRGTANMVAITRQANIPVQLV